MLEVVVVVTVLAISALAISTSVATTTSLNRSNRETHAALREARNAIERMRAEPLELVFSYFNGNPDDDPPGVDVPGNRFDVVGLTPWPGEPSVGEILFPGDGDLLLENVVDRDLGMPRDLNGDSLIDNLDHANNYRILPLRVRLRWVGVSGRREIELVTTL